MVARFADIDLHPETVSDLEMGYLYEELIRKPMPVRHVGSKGPLQNGTPDPVRQAVGVRM